MTPSDEWYLRIQSAHKYARETPHPPRWTKTLEEAKRLAIVKSMMLGKGVPCKTK